MGDHLPTRRHQISPPSRCFRCLSDVQGSLALSSGWIIRVSPISNRCMQLSLKEEGTSFLFRGIGSTVIRAFPMNAVTFGVFTFVMKKWGYKPEDMDHDTIENLQRKFNSGVCEVTFVLKAKLTFASTIPHPGVSKATHGLERQAGCKVVDAGH